jgi:ribosome-binding factor A
MQQNKNKKQRVQASIAKYISDIILFEMKKEIFRLVSVNQVDVTNDYSYAKVYVSHLDPRKVNEAVDALNKSKGIIRSSLAKKIDIYKVPELIFIKDDTYENGEKIEKILKDLNNK